MSMPLNPPVGKPGAGLPALELAVARVGFAVHCRVASRTAVAARFRAEADRLVESARPLDDAAARTRVLVRRVTGIEDNSRYWSAAMLLEHLVIVNRGIAGIIEHICAGEVFPDEVLVQQVKPHDGTGLETIPAFNSAVEEYCTRVGKVARLRSALRHRHPWFGELDGHGWHCLAALHHTVHRRQMARIVRTLAHAADFTIIARKQSA